MNKIKIGPSFFQKSRADYSNWREATIREFFQNSVDAGAKTIVFASKVEGDEVTLTCADDGGGMTPEIMETKLFALGESEKNFQGTVGGFGKAKELIYFSGREYTIHTNGHFVMGSGDEYEIAPASQMRAGTESVVVFEDARSKNMWAEIIYTYLSRCECKCAVLHEDTEHIEWLLKGEVLKEWEWGTLYSTPVDRYGAIYVRVNGIFMFRRYCNYKHPLILELKNSYKDLNANRDSLKQAAAEELDRFIVKLSTNPLSTIIKDKESRLEKYGDWWIRYLPEYAEEAIRWRPPLGRNKWLVNATQEACKACRIEPTHIGVLFAEQSSPAETEDGGLLFRPPGPKNRENLCKILSWVAHESVHIRGYSDHNEAFSSALTGLMQELFCDLPHILRRMGS